MENPVFRFHNCAEEIETEENRGVKAMGTRVTSDDRSRLCSATFYSTVACVLH